MLHRETFFTEQEYQNRLDKLRAVMSEEKIDLFITAHPSNVCYLIGHFTQSIIDMMFLAVPRKGQPVLVIPWFDHARFEASSFLSEAAAVWFPGDDPVPFVIDELRRRGLATGNVVVDSGFSYAAYNVITRIIDGLSATGRSNVVQEIRLAKSPDEQECLRKAAATTDAGVKAAFETATTGVKDFEIAGALVGATVRAGSYPLTTDPYVCVGWRTGVPHTNRGGEIVGDGDPIWIEFGGNFARYTAPIMRCAVAGKAPTELQDLAKASNEVIDAILPWFREGVAAREVAEVGNKAIGRVLDRIIFHKHYGYSIGLSFPPTWSDTGHFVVSAKNERPLCAGMVFHLPLMLRIKGKYGAGFSETVIVGHNGPEILSKTARELVSV